SILKSHFQNHNALKLLSVASLAAVALAPIVNAQQCPEAARFGVLEVTPSTVAPGDSFTVNVNLACSQQLGYLPTYMDYYIEVLANNNGHEAPILLARRTYDTSQHQAFNNLLAGACRRLYKLVRARKADKLTSRQAMSKI
ncbi:hypothetical protein B0H10DRAFT_14395, partial [Mycena sp. CBHHK59/15]